jgi:probable phosphoglycerate mutase
MHLFLIRHGETDWNSQGRIQGHTDTPLNARGIAQAQQLATRFAGEPLDALYASPLARARATAEIIAQKIGAQVICDERLKEKGIGALEGLTAEEFKQRHPDLYAAWHHATTRVELPGEESIPVFQQRIQTFLDDVCARHSHDARIALVTHGGTLGMLIATAAGFDTSKRLPFWFDNASVSVIEIGNARPRLRLLNDRCHLNEK